MNTLRISIDEVKVNNWCVICQYDKPRYLARITGMRSIQATEPQYGNVSILTLNDRGRTYHGMYKVRIHLGHFIINSDIDLYPIHLDPEIKEMLMSNDIESRALGFILVINSFNDSMESNQT